MSDNYKHFKLVQENPNFYEFEHNTNRLRVVVIPKQSHKQIIHAQMVYHIGSYDELVSYTGSTHLLEHLLFKNFEKSIDGDTQNIFQKLSKYGATINATTSTDRTNFYATIPSNVFDVWAACEAKRMQYAPFDVSNKDKKEKHVVVDELRIGQGNPFQKLTSAVVGAAFDRSGYSHLTAGSIADVKQTTQERLKDFHDKYYGPNNCSLVVVGPISVSKILKSVHNHFGKIKMRNFHRIQRDELEQNGPRSVAVYSKMPYSMFQLAFRNMEGKHKDSVVLDLISELMQYDNIGVMWMLKQMNAVPSFGVINNRTKHRYLFQIVGALPSPNPKVEQAVIAQIWNYLTALKQQDTPDKILDLVKKSLLNKYQSKVSGVEGLGALATEAVSLGDVNDIWRREEALKAITSADIKRVANYIFQPKRSTVGTLMPEPKGLIDRPNQQMVGYNKNLFDTAYKQQRMSRELLESFELPSRANLTSNRYRCKFGILQHLVISNTKKTYMVLTTKAASANDALAKVTSRVLREGMPQSQVQDQDKLLLFSSQNESRLMDNLHTYMTQKNMNFAMTTVKQKVSISVTLDSEHDLGEGIHMLLKAMTNLPALNAQQVAVKAAMEAGQWQGIKQDSFAASQQKLTEILFAKGDVNHAESPDAMINQLKHVTMKDMNNFKNDLFENGRPFAVTVLSDQAKNVENIGKAVTQLWDKFSGKKRLMEHPFDDHSSTALRITSQVEKITMKGKSDGHGVLGVRVSLDKNEPAWTHLSLAMNIFGSGMYSRLNKKLRIADGRTYGAYARLRGGQFASDSYVHVFASFSNKSIEDDTNAMRELWDEFVNYGVTNEEFTEAKMHMKNSLNVKMDNLNNLVGLSHNTLMNNKNLNLKTIIKRITEATLEDVNNAVHDHLKEKPVVTVIAGEV
jgi:zinc protease